MHGKLNSANATQVTEEEKLRKILTVFTFNLIEAEYNEQNQTFVKSKDSLNEDRIALALECLTYDALVASGRVFANIINSEIKLNTLNNRFYDMKGSSKQKKDEILRNYFGVELCPISLYQSFNEDEMEYLENTEEYFLEQWRKTGNIWNLSENCLKSEKQDIKEMRKDLRIEGEVAGIWNLFFSKEKIEKEKIQETIKDFFQNIKPSLSNIFKDIESISDEDMESFKNIVDLEEKLSKLATENIVNGLDKVSSFTEKMEVTQNPSTLTEDYSNLKEDYSTSTQPKTSENKHDFWNYDM